MQEGIKEYYAHISDDKVRKQTVLQHLEGTAQLAAQFANSFGCAKWGYNCGLLHDIGKYSEAFQNRLMGGVKTDHATAGAKELYDRKNILAAYCVAGHHSGLPNGGTFGDSAGEATLMGRMKKKLNRYDEYLKEVSFPSFSNPPLRSLGKGGFSLAFFIRILFSCLIDADYLDTESFMLSNQSERGKSDDIHTLLLKVKDYTVNWMNCNDELTINGRRTSILKACFEKGREEQGLYQLTVPTGGGKTVSSLAFALEHAKKHNLGRIIYVIPYTNIIEQNAQIFRNILGSENVLEDHSNVEYESEEELHIAQLAAENWDRSVVVTTNVQFFESLFACKASKCRKLHNVCNSVIIFDEAQMLPVNYLKPCIQAMSELIFNYRSTVVLCTATQPSLSDFFPKDMTIREICPKRQEQYEFFRRTKIQVQGEISEELLVKELKQQNQVLCILNSRKRVQRIYEELEGEGTYHLSTLMYPVHRKRMLALIRQRLKEGKECRVIATSLVEAGVDLDFISVYRELAGIDSVIQAAGRCNREGKKKKEECITYVFTFEQADDIHLPNELKLPIAVARQIVEQYEDIASLEAIHAYFRQLFYFKGKGLDSKDIVKQFENAASSKLFPFATIGKEFHIIESETKSMLIDIEEKAQEIVKRIRYGERSRQLFRDAGQYCINVYQNDFDRLMGAGRLQEIEAEHGLYLLRNKEQYTEERGLMIEVERGDAVFF